jgi:hypothetical protein
MPQSERPSSVIPFAAMKRPACPKCKVPMMLASIEPARAGVDLHTLECAICNHVLKVLAAYEDPMKSRGLGRWLQGDLHAPAGLPRPRPNFPHLEPPVDPRCPKLINVNLSAL